MECIKLTLNCWGRHWVKFPYWRLFLHNGNKNELFYRAPRLAQLLMDSVYACDVHLRVASASLRKGVGSDSGNQTCMLLACRSEMNQSGVLWQCSYGARLPSYTDKIKCEFLHGWLEIHPRTAMHKMDDAITSVVLGTWVIVNIVLAAPVTNHPTLCSNRFHILTLHTANHTRVRAQVYTGINCSTWWLNNELMDVSDRQTPSL